MARQSNERSQDRRDVDELRVDQGGIARPLHREVASHDSGSSCGSTRAHPFDLVCQKQFDSSISRPHTEMRDDETIIHDPRRESAMPEDARTVIFTVAIPTVEAKIEVAQVWPLLDVHCRVSAIEFVDQSPRITIALDSGERIILTANTETWCAYRDGQDQEGLGYDELAKLVNYPDEADVVNDVFNQLWQTVSEAIGQVTAQVIHAISEQLTTDIDVRVRVPF